MNCFVIRPKGRHELYIVEGLKGLSKYVETWKVDGTTVAEVEITEDQFVPIESLVDVEKIQYEVSQRPTDTDNIDTSR